MLTTEQLDILNHATHFPGRNYYCTHYDDPELNSLVELGLMFQGRTINNGRARFFHLTDEGFKAIGKQPTESEA